MATLGPWLEPGGFRGIERFLLPSERRVIAVRRHWARLLEPAATAALALVLLLWLDHVLPLVPYARCSSPAGWCCSRG